jgi:hypothetical protein
MRTFSQALEVAIQGPGGGPSETVARPRDLAPITAEQATPQVPGLGSCTHIDHTLADLLLAPPKRTQIQLLTRTIKGDGVLALKKLASRRGKLDVRIDPSDFHDRFILTDSSAYHLGPSIKDAGPKSAMISRIEDAVEAQRVRAQFDGVLNTAASTI